MTREEAIDILKCGKPFDDNPKADLDEFNLALGVAIKALKNENALLDRVLEIIKEYDLYKQDEDGDTVACKWEIWAEIKALKDGGQG